jgi:hypothetical protein
MNTVIAIPIFADIHRHPLHKDNYLSLIYVKPLGEESKMLTINHVDMIEQDDYTFLLHEQILTPSKKKMLSFIPTPNIYDMDLLNYYLYNKPINTTDIRVDAIEVMTSRYYKVNDVNAVIPLYKHQEWCDVVAEQIEAIWDLKDTINWDSYEEYNHEAVLAYYSIEKNGVPVSNDVVDIFDDRVIRHLSDRKLYSDYFLCTSAGRPSNSFGSVNFAALTPETRKSIKTRKTELIEFDYDAYHVRILGDIIDYDFPEESVHEHFRSFYGPSVSYEDSKALTFRYLYGTIPPEVVQLNTFFASVSDLSDLFWKEFETKGYAETPIFKRRILASNFPDMTQNKLLNYIIQATETERNIKTIINIQRYLYKKQTKLILYGYDSFLFDYDSSDGDRVLEDLRNILEQDKYIVKVKRGTSYEF